MIPPKVDSLGRVTEHPIDTWEPRSGVALALQELAPFLEPDLVSQLVTFFVTTGLGDRKPEVIINCDKLRGKKLFWLNILNLL